MVSLGYSLIIGIITLYIITREKYDLFLFSIASSIIYFLPLIFGFVKIKLYGQNYDYQNIELQMYFIHLFLILCMFIGHLFNKEKNSKVGGFELSLNNNKLNNYLFYIWCIATLAYFIILRGDVLSYKTDLAIKGGFQTYFRVIYNILLVMSVVSNYKSQRVKYIVLQSPILVLTIIQGHRSYLVFILLAIIFDLFINKKSSISTLKKMLILFSTLVFGFSGKIVVTALRMRWSINELLSTLFSPRILLHHITNSEPFSTQYILNQTIATNFTLPASYFYRYIMKILFISPTQFSSSETFYNLFKNQFVPGINYGIGYNIFSEPYAIAGIVGVFIFIVIYTMFVGILNKLVRSNNKFIASYALSFGTVSVFYIYRNSIENMILWFQIYTGILVGALSIYWILDKRGKIVFKKKM